MAHWENVLQWKHLQAAIVLYRNFRNESISHFKLLFLCFCAVLASPGDDSIPAKILSYNRANRAVAILCNHQRAPPKTFEKSMQNLQTKVKHLTSQCHCKTCGPACSLSLSTWCSLSSASVLLAVFADRREAESTVSSQEAAEGRQGRSQGFPWRQEQKVRQARDTLSSVTGIFQPWWAVRPRHSEWL